MKLLCNEIFSTKCIRIRDDTEVVPYDVKFDLRFF